MPTASKTSSLRIALFACLIAFVVGARWAVVDRYGSDLPTWDQWDAEGLHMLVPWIEHRFSMAELFTPQNEHRVVLTKLLNLGLTLANGQWDQRLECAVNAILPALIAAGLFSLGRRMISQRLQAPLFILVAVCYGLPLAWQNILGGFHSQQFFLIGLSFGAIAWLPCSAPGSGRWWLGAACAVLAMGSMATGFFAAAVVIAITALRLRRLETSSPAAAPALILCAALVVVGLCTQVTVGYHESIKSHTVSDFVMTALHSLQWPSSGPAWTWLAMVLWLPWICLVRHVLSETGAKDPVAGLTLAGLGGWVLLQIAATAYARGSGGPPPASRYVDTLIFGAVVNAIALGWLWKRGAPGGAELRLMPALGAAWIIAFGAGAAGELIKIYTSDLPAVRVENFYCEQNVRNYLATGDEAYLHHNEIPYPNVYDLIKRLRIPSLEAILPVSVRIPLPLAPDRRAQAFVEHDSRAAQLDPGEFERIDPGVPTGYSPGTPPLSNSITWGTFGTRGAAAAGGWKSAPLRAGFEGWLKFEIAGDAGEPGMALELRDAATGAWIEDVRPPVVPGNSWRAVYVQAPKEDFIVVAEDRDPQRWLAFNQPVEMAPWSYRAWRAVRNGRLIAEIAAGVAALVLVASATGPRYSRVRPRP